MCTKKKYDFIIIGGGASGCLVTYNLVKAGFTVALIEASENFNSNYYVQIPSLFGDLWGDVTYQPKDCTYDPAWNEWSFPSHSGKQPKIYDYVRGSNLGGSANHHAMVCFRGNPGVYDEWARITNDKTWRYDHVKTIFDDLQNNWLSISHTEPEEFELRFMQQLIEKYSIPFVPVTTECKEGVGFWDFMISPEGIRSSSSIELLPKMVKKKNLSLFTNCQATKVLFSEKGCAIGVEYYKGKHLSKADTLHYCSLEKEGPLYLYSRKEVILCGGAINSPQLLLLSGIGDPEQLAKFKINVVANVPQVGKNLLDHPEMWNNYELKNIRHRWQIFFPFSFNSPNYINYKDWKVGPTKYPFSATGLTKSIRDHNLHIGIYTIPSNNFNTKEWFFNYEYKKKTYASFLIELSNPKSKGELSLRSKDPFDVPIINLGLDTQDNAEAIADGVLFIRNVMESLSEDYEPIEVYPPMNLDRNSLIEFFKKESAYGHHISGTCAMSKVVDNNGSVFGVKRLRVVDTSIFPTIVTANPCFPVYMVAEKISREIIKKFS